MERTRLNREIAEQHGSGDAAGKTPGRDTAKETEEPHTGAAEHAEAAVADPESEQAMSQPQPQRKGLYARPSPLAAFAKPPVADPGEPAVDDATAGGDGGDPVTTSRRG